MLSLNPFDWFNKPRTAEFSTPDVYKPITFTSASLASIVWYERGIEKDIGLREASECVKRSLENVGTLNNMCKALGLGAEYTPSTEISKRMKGDPQRYWGDYADIININGLENIERGLYDLELMPSIVLCNGEQGMRTKVVSVSNARFKEELDSTTTSAILTALSKQGMEICQIIGQAIPNEELEMGKFNYYSACISSVDSPDPQINAIIKSYLNPETGKIYTDKDSEIDIIDPLLTRKILDSYGVLLFAASQEQNPPPVNRAVIYQGEDLVTGEKTNFITTEKDLNRRLGL